jgi:hypothetical protein
MQAAAVADRKRKAAVAKADKQALQGQQEQIAQNAVQAAAAPAGEACTPAIPVQCIQLWKGTGVDHTVHQQDQVPAGAQLSSILVMGGSQIMQDYLPDPADVPVQKRRDQRRRRVSRRSTYQALAQLPMPF